MHPITNSTITLNNAGAGGVGIHPLAQSTTLELRVAADYDPISGTGTISYSATNPVYGYAS